MEKERKENNIVDFNYRLKKMEKKHNRKRKEDNTRNIYYI